MDNLNVSFSERALVIERPRNVALAVALAMVFLTCLGMVVWGSWVVLTSWAGLTEVQRLFYSTRIGIGIVVCIPTAIAALDAWFTTRIIIGSEGVEKIHAGFRRSFVAWNDARELIVEHTWGAASGTQLSRRNYRIRLEGQRGRITASTSLWRWSVDDLRNLAFTLGRRLRHHNPHARILDYEEWVF